MYCLAILGVLNAGFSEDLGLRLRTGQHIWEHGLPRTDPFSVASADAPWVNPAWLFDLAIYATYSATDLIGLKFCAALVLVASVAVVLRLRGSGDPARCWTVSLAFALVASSSALTLSPELLDLLVASTLLFALERSQREPSTRWFTLPVLAQALWSNTSDGFVLGVVIQAAWLGGRVIECVLGEERPSGRAYWLGVLASFLASGAACVVSPFCFANVRVGCRLLVPLVAWDRRAVEIVPAYQSMPRDPGFSAAAGAFVGLTVAALCVLAVSRGNRSVAAFLVWLVVQALGWTFRRDVPMAAWMSAVMVARGFSTWSPTDAAEPSFQGPAWAVWILWVARRGARFAGLAGGLFSIALAACWTGGLARFIVGDDRSFGSTASDLAGELVESRSLAGTAITPDLSDAGALLWRAWPKVRPLVDTRLTVHGDRLADFHRLWHDIVQDYRAPYRREDGSEGGWTVPVRQYGVTLVIVPVDDISALASLGSSDSWAVLHVGRDRVVFAPSDDAASQATVQSTRERLREEADRAWGDRVVGSGPARRVAAWDRYFGPVSRELKARLRRGRALLAIGHASLAIREARQVLSLDPDNAAALELLGESNRALAHREHLHSGEASHLRQWAAVSFLGTAVRVGPTNERASKLHATLRDSIAKADSSSAASRGPKPGDATQRALRLLLDGLPGPAQETLRPTEGDPPDQPGLGLELLSVVRYVQGDHAEAIRAQREAIAAARSQPRYAATLCYQAAELYRELGDPQSARDLVQQALELDPELRFRSLILEWLPRGRTSSNIER